MVHGRWLVRGWGSPLLDVFTHSSQRDLLGIASFLAMARMRFMHGRQVCSGGGASTGGQQFKTVQPCACLFAVVYMVYTEGAGVGVGG